MTDAPGELFDTNVWVRALETYGAVTHLTVALYGGEGPPVVGPLNPTPLAEALHGDDHDLGLFAECARGCLTQRAEAREIVVTQACGVAVVGTRLLLEGKIVAAAVAGCVLLDFCQSVSIDRLARQAGVPCGRLWALARRLPPTPERRLLLQGELLRVLGDSLLRENHRTRQYEHAATELTTTAADLTAAAAVKDEFLAVLSHELRTPLTPILGWTRMLARSADPALVARAATVIERNALLQARLVDDLLELNRITRGKTVLDLKVHCLDDVLVAARDALTDAAAKKGVALEFEDAEHRLCINGDGDRLQQIFRNVLLNALKFTPSGGTVAVSLTREGDRGVVRIRDTGEGIAPEFLPFVFEMFHQQEQGTRRKHSGLGIGLALVKRLMEAHEASVDVTSAGVGSGTVVSLRFPLVDPPTGVEVARPLTFEAGPMLTGVRVLVVEDVEDALETVCAMLERLGADVLSASDGEEAMVAVAAGPVDLVLCDLRMPRMDGFEFLRELHRIQGPAHIPVIAVSGFTSSADHRRTEAAGFEGHIDKPFNDERLLAAVGAVLARRSTP